MFIPDEIWLTVGEDNGFVFAKERTDHKGIKFVRQDFILDFLKNEKIKLEGIIKQHPEDESLWFEMHWYDEIIENLRKL